MRVHMWTQLDTSARGDLHVCGNVRWRGTTRWLDRGARRLASRGKAVARVLFSVARSSGQDRKATQTGLSSPFRARPHLLHPWRQRQPQVEGCAFARDTRTLDRDAAAQRLGQRAAEIEAKAIAWHIRGEVARQAHEAVEEQR